MQDRLNQHLFFLWQQKLETSERIPHDLNVTSARGEEMVGANGADVGCLQCDAFAGPLWILAIICASCLYHPSPL